jgi:putative restriction endonuclease
MSTQKWTKDQLKLAFYLYCQLPFGKLHQHNPEIIKLASLIGRTPSAVAMKLSNFASLDPAITSSGRTGLGNASQADQEVWKEFHENWSVLAEECERLRESLTGIDAQPRQHPITENYVGYTRATTVEARLGQAFFRRAVLSGYGERCCMSGIADPDLLVASHILPWSIDRENRLNPRNGLCLSALHDRAFDKFLITVTPELKIRVSSRLVKQASNPVIRRAFSEIDGRAITRPERFLPDTRFLEWHTAEFVRKGQVEAVDLP